MSEYITWRTKRLIVNEQHSIRKHLDQGMMYFVGRDCNYKPILVMNVKKIHDSEISTDELVNITGFFFNFIVENMMIEGQVENWVIIIELQGMGVTGVMGVTHVVYSDYQTGHAVPVALLPMPTEEKLHGQLPRNDVLPVENSQRPNRRADRQENIAARRQQAKDDIGARQQEPD